MSLESKIKKVGFARNAIGYALPFLDKYDYQHEIEELQKDEKISRLELNERTLAGYLKTSANKNRMLYAAAKLADTSDRATSMILAPIIEPIGTALGLAPGWLAANSLEEGLEMALKAPFIAILSKRKEHRHYIKGIAVREAASFTPVLGDVYDAATNLYINIAKEVIREDAKRMILGNDSPRGGRGGRMLEERLPAGAKLALQPIYAGRR